MKIAFQYGISKQEIVEAMKRGDINYDPGTLENGDPESLLDDDSESWFRGNEKEFTEWAIAYSARKPTAESVQRMFAHLQLSIGYLRRELAQIRLERRI